MDSPLGISRPWTPPETDTETSPESDYFAQSLAKPSQRAPDAHHAWAGSLHGSEAMGIARCDTPTEDVQSRPKPVSALTAPVPYTPTKNPNARNVHMTGALQYPYTPDSSRILSRSITELPSSPIPWGVTSDDSIDQSPEKSPSPIQSALSSCIAHFEDLLRSNEPDDAQIEYLVGQFEAMANHLSPPESQTETTEEHLVADDDSGFDLLHAEESHFVPQKAALTNEYVEEVDSYIESVSRYIGELKMRLDEVRALNSIQCDVIQDLRRQMKAVRQGMRNSLRMGDDDKASDDETDKIEEQDSSPEEDVKSDDEEQEFGFESWETLINDDKDEEPSSSQDIDAAYSKELQRIVESQLLDRPALKPRTKIITIVRKPEKRSFWRSFGEALDAFGELLHEE